MLLLIWAAWSLSEQVWAVHELHPAAVSGQVVGAADHGRQRRPSLGTSTVGTFVRPM